MKVTPINIKCIILLGIFICNYSIGTSQCISSTVQQGSGYINSTCGTLQIQSLVTQNANLFGDCGEIRFTPPIGGEVIPTGVITIVNSPIIIYPNPFPETFTIDLANKDKHTIKIFNTVGSLIYSGSIVDGQEIGSQIKIQGLYVVRLFNDFGQLVLSQQIIKI